MWRSNLSNLESSSWQILSSIPVDVLRNYRQQKLSPVVCSRKPAWGYLGGDIRLWLGTMMNCRYHKRHTGSVVDILLQKIWIKWIDFPFPLLSSIQYAAVLCDFGGSVKAYSSDDSLLLVGKMSILVWNTQ